MTDTLTARLLAEIERREKVAREAMSATGGSWEHAGNGVFWIEGDEQRIILGEAHGHVTPHIAENDPHTVLAYLAALRKVVELVGTWTHEVVEDCWYTCAAATDERDGGETCSDARRGGACDCGLDTRRSQVLAIIAEGLGVEVE